MADTEIESFITKFKHLCKIGINASLNLSSCNGKATVMLHAELGYIPPPSNVPPTPRKHRSPAYNRRIVRRQAMRENIEECPIVKAEEDSTMVENVTLNEAVKPDLVEDAATTSSLVYSIETERAEEVHEDVTSEERERIDKAERELDKVVEKVYIYAVPPSDIRQRIPDAEEVEIEIRDKFSGLGIEVRDIHIFTSRLGKYESSVVKISPTNLKRIWGRRLGLKTCAVVECNRPQDVT